MPSKRGALTHQKPTASRGTHEKITRSSRQSRRNKEKHQAPELRALPGLVKGLKGVFNKIHKDRIDHEHAQEKIIENFSARLEHVFDEMHKEFDERERVLDKKLQRTEKEQAQEIRRVRWLSIPVGALALAGLVYLFYVVHVMEQAMSSMSGDMSSMNNNITTISEDTRNMSHGVTQMTGSMTHMTRNMAGMNRNVGAMTRSIAPMGQAAQTAGPMMGMMRSFMPF